jgi:hypothetical protein
MGFQLFYDIPNSFLLFSFVLFGIILAVAATALYSAIVPCGETFFNNSGTDTYIGTVAAAFGVVLAFTVTNEWQVFRDIQILITTEANTLYNMYYTALYLENSTEIVDLIKEYICAIIYIEFPEMELGIIPPDDTNIVRRLLNAVYAYEPNISITNQETLYSQTITLLNRAIQLRAERIESLNSGLAMEIWWVLIGGYFIILAMCLLLTGTIESRLLCTSFVSVVYIMLLFLAVALDSPFQGDFGLEPLPYIYVKDTIGFTCPEVGQDTFLYQCLQERRKRQGFIR